MAGPKQTRDRERSRKEILDAAFREIYARGFQGVSVDEIVGKTSLTKGAFYHFFPTKLDLGYALVDEIISPLGVNRWVAPLKSYDNPVEGILALLRELIGEASPAQLKMGCPLNNLVQEMAPLDMGFKRRLQAALNIWIEGLSQELARAKARGFLKREVNTRQAAHFVVMAHEGFYGMLKGSDDPEIFKALYASLKIYFRAISA
jgi:TetR/AcrR family transcriptional repressor of nem operon